MVDAVTARKLNDGDANVVYHLTNISDSTGEAAVQKIDFSALSGAAGEIRIERIKFATSGMSVQLLWDADTDDVAMLIPADVADEWCFKEVGGLINPKSTGWTGDINLTTIGAAANDYYDITLTCRKRT